MSGKVSEKTKESLLVAAGAIFARKGFRYATIAEICKEAGANVAAVNYHFGSKENLYGQSWRHAMKKSLSAHPPDGGVAPDAPAATRLRGMIKGLIERVSDENNNEMFIVHHELANPTGLLAEVMHAEMRPLQEMTVDIVKELLGPHASEREIRYCEVSIITLCIHPMLIRRADKTFRVETHEPPGLEDIKAYTDHVVSFAMAGIMAVKEAAIARSREEGP